MADLETGRPFFCFHSLPDASNAACSGFSFRGGLRGGWNASTIRFSLPVCRDSHAAPRPASGAAKRGSCAPSVHSCLRDKSRPAKSAKHFRQKNTFFRSRFFPRYTVVSDKNRPGIRGGSALSSTHISLDPITIHRCQTALFRGSREFLRADDTTLDFRSGRIAHPCRSCAVPTGGKSACEKGGLYRNHDSAGNVACHKSRLGFP